MPLGKSPEPKATPSSHAPKRQFVGMPMRGKADQGEKSTLKLTKRHGIYTLLRYVFYFFRSPTGTAPDHSLFPFKHCPQGRCARPKSHCAGTAMCGPEPNPDSFFVPPQAAPVTAAGVKAYRHDGAATKDTRRKTAQRGPN